MNANKSNSLLKEARDIMAIADRCDTPEAQAINLYWHAQKILRSVPSSALSPEDQKAVQRLVSSAEECSTGIFKSMAVDRTPASRQFFAKLTMIFI